MRTFDLEIVTPDGSAFSGPAEKLIVRTTEGDVEILAGHVDYLAKLATGKAQVTVSGVTKSAAVSGGFISVSGGNVRLVATTFEYAENIDLKRAQLAQHRAEEQLRNAKDEQDENLARARLSRALTRVTVAKK